MCAQIHTQHEVDVAARVYSASVQQACAAGTASVGMTATVPINLKISHIKDKSEHALISMADCAHERVFRGKRLEIFADLRIHTCQSPVQVQLAPTRRVRV